MPGWKHALEHSYANKITDEFIKPTIVIKDKEEVLVNENDVVIFFNFRADRARQITSAFMDEKFKEFNTLKFKNIK